MSSQSPHDPIDAIIEGIEELTRVVRELARYLEGPMPDIRSGISYYEEVANFERHLILAALACTAHHQSRAADLLGINAKTLNSRMKALNMDRARVSKRHPSGPGV